MKDLHIRSNRKNKYPASSSHTVVVSSFFLFFPLMVLKTGAILSKQSSREVGKSFGLQRASPCKSKKRCNAPPDRFA